MKLYLIGMPGSGKTTIAKKISEILNLSWFDTDSIIEKKYGPINEIFKNNGEDYFRKLETYVLKELKCKDDCIISCGGGIVLREENKNYMNGTIIYLRVDVLTLENRLKADTKRPLLKNLTLSNLFNQRKDKYLSFKDIVIDNNDINQSIKELLEEIKSEKENINN